MQFLAEDGKALLLAKLLGDSYSVRLFVNNRAPQPDDTAKDYDEPSGGGYAPITLEPGQWNRRAFSASYPPVTFRFTAHVGDVYGFVVTHASGRLMWCQRFDDGPYRVAGYGFEIEITIDVAI